MIGVVQMRSIWRREADVVEAWIIKLNHLPEHRNSSRCKAAVETKIVPSPQVNRVGQPARSMFGVRRPHLLCTYCSVISGLCNCGPYVRLAFVPNILSSLSYYLFIIFWARSCENVSYAICEQQRCRSACAIAQSDQHFCCSLLR